MEQSTSERLSELEEKQYLTGLYDLEPLSELQKKQYLAEIGLDPVLNYYNKEILKHRGLCKLSLELRKKRDRCFKLMREEYRELC